MLEPVNPAALETTAPVHVLPSPGPVPALPGNGHVHKRVEGLLDAERLHVYRVALEFQTVTVGQPAGENHGAVTCPRQGATMDHGFACRAGLDRGTSPAAQCSRVGGG